MLHSHLSYERLHSSYTIVDTAYQHAPEDIFASKAWAAKVWGYFEDFIEIGTSDDCKHFRRSVSLAVLMTLESDLVLGKPRWDIQAARRIGYHRVDEEAELEANLDQI